MGRPCAGKSTLAAAMEKRLEALGVPVTRLEGDDMRNNLCADLGFTEKDRLENLRRAAHVAQLFNEKGHFVIAAFVTPTNEMRRLVRGIIRKLDLCYVKCAAELCEKRDVKGMYKKARLGQIKDFTGVSAPFEEPPECRIIVDTGLQDVEQCAERILRAMELEALKI